MKRNLALIILNLFFSCITMAMPKYVFMFIGDGLGSSQRQITEYYMKETNNLEDYSLLMNQFPVAGINTTHSTDSLITDSAAAGTALATGYKTNSGMIAMLPNGKKVKSIIEYAEKNGMKTGIISTTRLTHATPAVFASNNQSRDNENEIAADFVDSNVDFFAGGGYRHFISKDKKGSKRKDNMDLVSEFQQRGYKTFVGEDSSKDFENLKADKNTKVFAAFTSSHLPYEIDRISSNSKVPSLAEITKKGIEVLNEGDNGFFMMVEGGRIDHAAHANDAKSVIYDTLALDDAVKEAYKFYKSHPEETLILVVGDHETGGLGLGIGKDYFLNLAALQNVNYSVEDILQSKYKGNKTEYVDFVKREMGLADLTPQEEYQILEAMKIEDKKNYDEVAYGGYKPTAIAVAHILANRANIMFTTFAHTGTQIPLSAIGDSSTQFSGFKDNTEIGKELINIVR